MLNLDAAGKARIEHHQTFSEHVARTQTDRRRVTGPTLQAQAPPLRQGLHDLAQP
jgi:hypothetical protein